MSPLFCYRGHGPIVPPDSLETEAGEITTKKTMAESAAMIQKNTEISGSINDGAYMNGTKPDDPVIFLVSDLLPPDVSKVFVEALDTLCPPLESTPRLEDKALRIVMSLCHEVCVAIFVNKFAITFT